MFYLISCWIFSLCHSFKGNTIIRFAFDDVVFTAIGAKTGEVIWGTKLPQRLA